MAILNIETAQPAGLTSVIPNLIYVNTSDTYAQVTAIGYLTAQSSQGYTFSNEQMALVYTSDEGAVWLKVVITYSGSSVLNTVVSLSLIHI
jgi:V8-like Glu-specific endopeptidase